MPAGAGITDRGGFDTKVLALKPDERVRWEVVDGPAEWIGTKVDWELRREDDHSIVHAPLQHQVGGVPLEL